MFAGVGTIEVLQLPPDNVSIIPTSEFTSVV
jgi:hypothetical protein